MCKSFENSVIAGALSYAASLYLWMRNVGMDRWFSLLLFTFSSIQWCEALLWYDQQKQPGGLASGSQLNRMVTKYAISGILALEPLMALIGNYASPMEKRPSLYMVILYCLISTALFIRLAGKTNHSHVNEEGSIKWNSTSSSVRSTLMYAGLLILPFLLYGEMDERLLLLLVAVLAIWGYSALNSPGSIGSNWCYYSVALAMLFLTYPYLSINEMVIPATGEGFGTKAQCEELGTKAQ